MSHFTVMVIGDNPEKQLAPFDENIEMPRYVRHTKEQLISNERASMEKYKNGWYAEYLADPEKYAASCSNEAHLNYLKNEFPKKLTRSDEEIYTDEIEGYEPEEISPEGGVYSTYNPNSKWDWYTLGGRWSGLIKLKSEAVGVIGKSGVFDNETGIDQAKKGDIINLDELKTFAIIKDGQWYEKGKMGWWAMVSDEKEEDKWQSEFKELLNGLPDDTLISIYDCHI